MQVVHSAPAVPGGRSVIPRDRLLRLPEVQSLTSCSKSTIYELMRQGKFPRNIKLNRRMAMWPETAVLQWVQDRIQEARAATEGGAQ